MYTNTQNPNALATAAWDIVGGYFIFAPDPHTPFYDVSKKPIHFGHVNKTAETHSATRKDIQSGVYGKLVQIGQATTATTEGGSFETVSVHDPVIRGLWAGAKTVTAGVPATPPFATTHAYALGDNVAPSTANGFYYTVTTAGTSDAAEPVTWATTAGQTTTSGDVTFTAHALGGESGIILAPKNHLDIPGMLINVIQSAVTGRNPELSVYPNITLSGDGYGGGRDSINETSLKFTYSVLAPSPTYQIPPSVGAFGVQTFLGGYDLLNVPIGGENAVIDNLIAGYYGA